MPREPKAYLHDMRQAAALIAEFTEGLVFNAYAADAMVRAAMEREFEIIGEALGQLAKLDPETASRIGEHRRAPTLDRAFRQVVLHGRGSHAPRLARAPRRLRRSDGQVATSGSFHRPPSRQRTASPR